MYSPTLIDHAVHPRNTGPLPGATHAGEARYERCGDRMRLEFLVADGRVREARGQAFGCGAAVAAASVATELLQGLNVTEARNLDAFRLDRALGGVPPAKRHALLMVLLCVAEALGPRIGAGPPRERPLQIDARPNG
jgi:NifU-like protein involved in Fe-S cluster formation